MKERCSVTLADILLLSAFVLLALSAILIPQRVTGNTVTVTTEDGILTYPTGTDRTASITSHGHSLTLRIKDGGVSITDADCPDGLCKRMGEVRDSSRVIVCAPAKVVVRITSSEGGASDADIIIGR